MAKREEALTEAAGKDADIAPYIELHRELMRLQDEARKALPATLERADERPLQGRLEKGTPLLDFAQLGLEAERFAQLATGIAQALRDSQVELEDGPDPDTDAEWLALAEGRFAGAQCSPATTIAQAAADLALRPYLEWAAEQLLDLVDLAGWKEGHCPICGGEPDFASLDEEVGARRLLCSQCTTEWSYRRVACPFCGTTDHTKLSYFPAGDGVYRLYVCQGCKRYLKTIDLRHAGREVLLPVERITTLALDVAARQEGYS